MALKMTNRKKPVDRRPGLPSGGSEVQRFDAGEWALLIGVLVVFVLVVGAVWWVTG